MTNLDSAMLELAEFGKLYLSPDECHSYGLDEDTIRDAAREDGVQVRFTYDSCDNLTVTLRKIGLGH